MRLVLAGVSTRAMAESAAHAGFEVTAIDAFADLDQHVAVRPLSLGDTFSPGSAARKAQTISCDAVAYAANFENHPHAVEVLAEGRALWGNSSEVLRRVRDPKWLSQMLRRHGLASPEVSEQPPEGRRRSPQSPVPSPQPPVPSPQRRWLLKRYASGGGHGVREWRNGMAIPPGSYFQELIDGAPSSIVFVASDRRAVPIGFTRQLIGDEAFGSSGFRYCGNILTAVGEDDDILDAARAVIAAVCAEYGLVGVNGIDLVVKGGAPYAIEVNPRWCASMELVERAYSVSVFGMHAAACRDGVLPDFDLWRARGSARTTAKAVVFARGETTVGDTRPWLSHGGDRRDIPNPGTRLHAGQPVCTVFAEGRDSEECRAELVRRADLVYALIERRRERDLPYLL
ncbi:MAG TPA: ATP-grasp domain-containing protein [Vicinamibacterales bacterium]|nr:ATP-grasp domain-containing protein [Vicinamibacterales bacterium]